MIITRSWCMPNKNTFKIKPIKEFIDRVINSNSPNVIIEPFANTSQYGTITNDLNPEFNTTYNLDALDFLKLLGDETADMVLYDPPFSSRQVSECYKSVGKIPEGNYTTAAFWSRQKDEISRILKPGGIVMSFGWNSNGIGKSRNCFIEEILMVAHGGPHNDTIITQERKILS
ncbi:MAG: hypothetical protein [Caudoviricetes sp.]|nr:MAG: hypothetical protein [Caudoviricetes sp.]